MNKQKFPKFTKQPDHLSRTSTVLIMLCLLIVLVALLTIRQHLATHTHDRWLKQKHMLMEGYLRAHPNNSEWWLHKPDKPSSATVNAIMDRSRRLRKIIEHYAHVDLPLSREIAESFKNIHTSMLTDGGSVSFSHDLKPPTHHDEDDGIEVYFIARDEFISSHVPTYLWYRPPWHAIMIAGVEWPDAVLAGRLYHELGHALRHQRDATSAQMPEFSKAWVQEEVRMHRLEYRVLDAATQGAYSSTLRKILKKREPINALDAAVCAVPLDLIALDAVLGATETGSDLARTTALQYSLSLAEYFLHNHTDRDQERINEELAEIYLHHTEV